MLTIDMTHTTIDIKNLKRVKREAVNRDITIKELVNRAIDEYLKKHAGNQGDDKCRGKK